MVIPSKIKTKYIPSGPNKISATLHIEVGEAFEVEKGDIIILHPKKTNKIEIKQKPAFLAPNFKPYYA